MTRAQPSLSTSLRQIESSEDLLNSVGIIRLVITRKMRKPLYFQLIENRFTGSLMLIRLSFVVLGMALALEELHYN